MKRKLFLTAVTVIMIASCAIGFAACGDDTHEEHVLTHVAATEATCTENGNSEYWSCSDCGKYFSDAQATTEISRSDTVVPAKGHTYGEWEIIKEATCTEDGTEERECSVCHATEQQAVPSAGHAFSADWSYDDTEHWHACQNCGEVRGTAAHTYVGGVCSVCGAHEPSVGLEYALNHDGTGYSVQGMGSCTDTDIVIPSAYNGLPVTSVGESAFYNCTALTSIIIPDSVTTIEKSAFLYCSSLASITIPDSVTEIKDSAFSGCRSLASVTLPDSITSIGKYVFYLCYDLKSITIPDSVIEIEDYAFSACTGLESIAFPSSVESIGKYSFSDCTSLTTLSIPENVTHIDEYAFDHCTALTNIVLHEKMGNIMRGVFSDCTSLTSITIPDSVIDISTNAFENCSSLEEIILGSGVTSLGSYAFSGCTSLTSITIPENVKAIGSYAFSDCTSLNSIDIGSGVTTIGNAAFSGCTSLASATFRNTSGWQVSDASTGTGGTSIADADLSDSATAATYLSSTYCDCDWKRG